MTDRAADWYRQSMQGVKYEIIAHHARVTNNTVAGAIWRHRQATGLPGWREKGKGYPVLPGSTQHKAHAAPAGIPAKAVPLSPLDTLKATVTCFADVVEHNTCRYIGGGIKGPDTYCGNHRAKGSDYCHGCHAVVYRAGTNKINFVSHETGEVA